MTKKIAIPMENGTICPHFGHCEYFAIVTVQNNQISEIILFDANIFYGLIGVEGTSENQESLEAAVLSKYGLIMLIPIVFFAPIIEELIFRKFIFGIIEDKLKWSAWSAILISTVVFSLMHLLSGDFQYILLYLPQAFVMGIMYHFSKNNIFVPITIHFINNLLAAIGILVLRGLA